MGEPRLDALNQRFAEDRRQLALRISSALAAFVRDCDELGLTLDYDSVEDILFIYLGTAPRASVTEHISGPVYVRLDPREDRIVGIEILAFSSVLKDNLGLAAALEPFAAALRHCGAITLPPHSRGAAATALELEKHLGGCAPCQAFLKSLETTVEALRRQKSEGLAPEVVAQTRSELRNQWEQMLQTKSKEK